MVIRRVIRKIPLAVLFLLELTAHVKAAAFINSAKLIAAVSKVLFCANASKKTGKGLPLAFQK